MDTQDNIQLFLEMSCCIPNLFYHRYEVTDGVVLPSQKQDYTPDEITDSYRQSTDHLLHQLFLSCDYLTRTCQYAQSNNAPYALGTYMGLIWYAVLEKDANAKLHHIHILGPALQSIAGDDRLEQLLRAYEQRGMTFTAKHVLVQAMKELPILSHNQFASYALMLHYCVTGEHLSFGEVNTQPDDLTLPSTAGATSSSSDSHLSSIYQNIYRSEGMMIQHMQLDEKPQDILPISMAFLPTESSHITDPLRRSQDQAVIIVASCARAAIASGLPTEEAYAIADAYIGRIEQPHSPTGMVLLLQEMYQMLWEGAYHARHKEMHQYSPVIADACAYIKSHICEVISLEELALAHCLSTYYFSQLFHKEVGQSFLSYVKEEKIKYAAHLLLTTEDSVEDVIHKIGLTSQGHFYTDFKKIMGVTPRQWRKHFRF